MADNEPEFKPIVKKLHSFFRNRFVQFKNAVSDTRGTGNPQPPGPLLQRVVVQPIPVPPIPIDRVVLPEVRGVDLEEEEGNLQPPGPRLQRVVVQPIPVPPIPIDRVVLPEVRGVDLEEEEDDVFGNLEVSDEEQDDDVSVEEQVEEIPMEEQDDDVSAEEQDDDVSLEEQVEEIPMEEQDNDVSAEEREDDVSVEEQVEEIPMEEQDDEVSVEEQVEDIPMEEQDEEVSVEEQDDVAAEEEQNDDDDVEESSSDTETDDDEESDDLDLNVAVQDALARNQRVYRNCFVINQRQANRYLNIDVVLDCKSIRKTNKINAIVGVFALVGEKFSRWDAAQYFGIHKYVLNMQPTDIIRLYNTMLRPRRLKLLAAETKWDRVFPDTNPNSIIVLFFGVKEDIRAEYQTRVAVYDSISKILVPFNVMGRACYIGKTVRTAATEADRHGMHQPIINALRRHLYPGITCIQLMAVYKLYKLPTK